MGFTGGTLRALDAHSTFTYGGHSSDSFQEQNDVSHSDSDYLYVRELSYH